MHHQPTTPAPVLADIYAAALATNTRPGTLRVWLHRGRLTHHGHDRNGRTLVDLEELRSRLAAKAA
ncbi:hypothetical protein RKE29_02085 [Streptomyces sp. B1866]|uniref:hypothetical protein n=1 Tax=Streptomyces sp. B1866 TaxID=3075431 RepID=UPI00288F99E2|nr:hypothetical protein [Streptomyces sp. B1866]MDT3395450.1 hypothetical protein [Streptomyces sp. B1866]